MGSLSFCITGNCCTNAKETVSMGCQINILTKFHKDWMKTVTSIVYTSDSINILTKFHQDWMQNINILTKFHKDWMKTINILTKFHKDWMKTINILTKFHKDWMKTVTSTVYTNKLLTDAGHHTSHKLTMSLCDR
ncbi:hypothetical protein DPMN_113032 [Dreissena polymorpha]|nr:hypothetical protein DPMN_113032 [Dreissena polymorpha]